MSALSFEKLALTAVELREAVKNVEPEPTQAQQDAGNYRKGHVKWHGLDLTIETPAGFYRRGKDKDGKPWQTLMKDHYGYIKRTESEADGDHIDVFLAQPADAGSAPATSADLRSQLVFVVNQVSPDTGVFDEHKCILGTVHEEDARRVYLRNYSRGWKGLGSIAALTLEQFKWWIHNADTSRPLKDGVYAVVNSRKKAEDTLSTSAALPEKSDADDDTVDRLKQELAVDAAVGDARILDQLTQDKMAAAYRVTGDAQGVHLRTNLHKLLDQYGVGGVAYNDARNNSAYAVIDGDAVTRKKILAELVRKTKGGQQIEEVPDDVKMLDVDLDNAQLEKMFRHQGFTDVGTDNDPNAYRRAWAMKRYRLQEDLKSGHLVGKVPELAHKQLMGLEPVYSAQLHSPDKFGGRSWNSPISKADLSSVLSEKTAAAVPGILRVYREKTARDTPFTVAVDLDGTLAEKQVPFDPKTIGEPRDRAKHWLDAFKDAGARIVIHTVRGDTEQVAEWLDKHDIPYDYINENPEQPEGSSDKLYADVYFDDRAVDATDLDAGAEEVLGRIGEQDEDVDKSTKPGILIEHRTFRVLLAPDDILEELLERHNDADRDTR